LDEPVDKDINKRVAANTGLDITGHVLEFRGLCKDCKT
jgi:Fe2+ or Zn2+ uptake regulation protein